MSNETLKQRPCENCDLLNTAKENGRGTKMAQNTILLI